MQTRSYLIGDAGLLLAEWRLAPSPDLADTLAEVIGANTDDPTLHNVSPAGAWALMYSHLGYGLDDLRAMMLNGIDGCWADADQRAQWRSTWPATFDQLALAAGWLTPDDAL